MTFGSLFAGIGGLDLGLERAGMVCKWQVEIDRDCVRVLSRHWPGVTRYGDITQLSSSDLAPVDLVCGGFPCQDLSVAGRRAGLDGERSGLFFEFMRVVAGLRSRWVLIENVPGLLSSQGGRDMGIVIGTLADLGFWWAYRVLDAQYHGVAQRRRRVFIVGHSGDRAAPVSVLFEPESGEGYPPPCRETGAGVTPLPEIGARTSGDGDRDGDGIGDEGDVMYTLQTGKQHGVAATLTAGVAASSGVNRPGRRTEDDVNLIVNALSPVRGGPDDNDAQAGHLVVAHTLRAEGADASEDGTGRGVPLVAQPLRSNRWGGADSHGDEGNIVAQPLRSNPYNNSDPNMEAHMHIRQGMTVRRLTPRECERLQGFPDDWTVIDAQGEKISDSARYRMLGNAVCIPVAEWIGRRIVAAAHGEEEE